MKNKSKLKYYPLSAVQKSDLILYAASFRHTQIANIPISIYVDEEIDVELMREAIRIEVQRNDSLRVKMSLRFFRLGQCFLPELDIGEIPFDDLSDKTDEEFTAYYKEQSYRPLAVFKGISFRVRIFRAPNGRYGLLGTFCHVFHDAFDVGLFYRDTLKVYTALKNGLPLPPPLNNYEDTLQKDFALYKNKAHMKRVAGFYDRYFDTPTPSLYSGVDGMRELTRVRTRWHAPKFRGVPIFHPFHDEALTVDCGLERELTDRMTAFCAERKVSLQSLFQLGIRTHLSKINENTDDVSVLITVARRCTKEDINSGGSRALTHMMRTVLPDETTFGDALKAIDRCNLSLYKHSDYPFLREVLKQGWYDKRIPWFTPMSLMLTFFPQELMGEDVGMKYEFFSRGSGYMHISSYVMIAPSLITGQYSCHHIYQPNIVKLEDVWLLHENMIKIIDEGMKDPDIAIGKLRDRVL